MNKKAFTLVELLSVVVILAVIALIVTPMIIKVLNEAEKKAFKESVNGMIRAVNNDSDKQGYVEMNYTVTNGRLYDSSNNRIHTGGGDKEFGSLTINDEGQITLAVHNDKWCATKEYDNNKIKLDEYKNGKCEIKIDICHTVSFEKDSWETISCAVKNNELDNYKIGDEKEVTLTGDYAGTYTVRIANTTTPTECSNEGFSQTACGFVAEFKDIITQTKMNSKGTNIGGWPSSEMYSLVNTNIYNALSEDLKKVIIDTKVISGHGLNDNNNNNFTSTDKLYLLNYQEVWGANSRSYDTSNESTRQLDYYLNSGVTPTNYSGVIKQYNGKNGYWWLRSAVSTFNDKFYGVSTNGNNNITYATIIYGVAPAFRIG